MRIVIALALLPLLAPDPSSRDIQWRGSFPETMAAAAEQKRVVFLAVNMDGERTSDRMAREVYRDATVVELAGRALAMVASAGGHAAEGKTCPRFGSVTCRDHQGVDVAARRDVLEPDEQGFVVAPQHVFLAPDGTVLLSVPFEIGAEELEWCLVTALLAVDPEVEVGLSPRARAPRRLIHGGVLGRAAAGEAAPITREEALELIALLKKGTLDRADSLLAIRRLATADEKEARDYVLSLLRAGPGLGRGGRGGGAGGGGGVGGGRGGGRGGGGAAQDQGQGQDWRLLLLRWIGYASPQSYWEVCVELVGSGELAVQQEAIVALEQLGAPASLGALQARLRREKEPTTVKKLLRAIGATGRDDRNARSVLLKHAQEERTPVLAANALVGLGSLTRHAEVQGALRQALEREAEDDLRAAAVIAVAFTRDREWLEPLREQLAAEPGAELGATLQAAIAVLEGGPLSALREPLARVAEDSLNRPRFFGLDRQRP